MHNSNSERNFPSFNCKSILSGVSARHATKISDKFGFKVNATYKRGDEFTLDLNDPADAARIPLYQKQVFAPAIANGVVDPTQQGRLLLDESDLDPDGDGDPLQSDFFNTAITGTLEFRPQDDFSVNVSGGYNTASGIFFNNQGEGLAQNATTWGQARMQKGGLFAQAFFANNNGGSDERPNFLYQTGNQTFNASKQFEA